MRRTEIISGTMAAETVAAETKAGKGRLSGAKKAVTAFCGAAYLAVGGAIQNRTPRRRLRIF